MEVSQWTFAPAAAAVLAEFGADVIKVERVSGDPQRALVSGGVVPEIQGINVNHEQVNRGKRSITVDLKSAAGRQLLADLVKQADVFVTNYLPHVRRALAIDVDDLRKDNPDLIYAIGSAYGSRGDEAGSGGYDMTSYWLRGGIASSVAQDPAARPPDQPGALGDRYAAMNLAFGIAAALYRRKATGTPSVVETSLLAAAIWQNGSSIAYSLALGSEFRRGDRPQTNPLVQFYRTADGRWLQLVMQESDRYWDEMCVRLDRLELVTDERFADSAARARHYDVCVTELQASFGAKTADEVTARFTGFAGPWAFINTAVEAGNDPQVLANEYIQSVDYGEGRTARLVSAPVQFDGVAAPLPHAPSLGEHTDEILLNLGRTPDEIAALRNDGVI